MADFSSILSDKYFSLWGNYSWHQSQPRHCISVCERVLTYGLGSEIQVRTGACKRYSAEHWLWHCCSSFLDDSGTVAGPSSVRSGMLNSSLLLFDKGWIAALDVFDYAINHTSYEQHSCSRHYIELAHACGHDNKYILHFSRLYHSWHLSTHKEWFFRKVRIWHFYFSIHNSTIQM